jgi:Zn-dependent M28 family amino/carboxypeptidase
MYEQPFLDVTFASTDFPVIAITYEVALELANTTCRIFVNNSLVDLKSYSVIAESRTGNPKNVVSIGAHLDSPSSGPGIEDNGTGAAALLEVALGMAKLHPTRRLRFAWWGAEETGIMGSMAYARDETNVTAGVSVYLNVDMIGSQNYIFGIYGNLSDTQGPTSVLKDFYQTNDIPYQEIPNVTCRSDTCGFHLQGIPVAGSTSVSIPMRKTATEASLYGGTAGELYDPCYHLPCDNLTNANSYPLEINTEAVAYAAMVYAMKQVSGSGDAVHATEVLATHFEPAANETLTDANRSLALLYPVVGILVLLCLKWGRGLHRSCRRRYDTTWGSKYRKQ